MKKNISKVTLHFIKRNSFTNIKNNLSEKEKSDMICQIILGIPLPLIVVEEKDDTFFVLSGGDIISTIQQFIKGDLKIDINKNIDKNIIGKTFIDFTDNLKDEFLESEIVISTLVLSSQERENLIYPFYFKENSVNIKETSVGSDKTKSNNIEVSKDKSHSKVTGAIKIDKELDKMLKHGFLKKVNISPLSNDVIVSLFMVSENGAVSELSAKKIQEFKENLTEIPDFYAVADYLDNAFRGKTLYLKKAHLPMIYVCAQTAIKQELTPQRFKEIIDRFFESNNKDYKKASDNGTSSKTNVNTRIKIMTQFFKQNI